MKYISLLFLFIVLGLTYLHSSRPLVSDLNNYNTWFENIRSWHLLEIYNFHQDKGYLFLNIIFSKWFDLSFRQLLFSGVLFVYLAYFFCVFRLRKKIEGLTYAVLLLVILIAAVHLDVSHYFRQYMVGALLPLIITIRQPTSRGLMGFFALTLHISILPFILFVNLFDILVSIVESNKKKILLCSTFFILNLGYFFLTNVSRTSHAIGSGGESIVELPVLLFWIVVALMTFVILLDKSENFLLNQRTRYLGLLLVLLWLMIRFIIAGNYHLSIRFSAFSGCFLFILLVSSLKKESLSRNQKLGMLIIIAVGVYSYFLEVMPVLITNK